MLSSLLLYYIIAAEWEFLFIHSSPTHTAAAVKAKAANWDVWRHLLYGTKNFFLAKRLENCLVSSFERRDETRRLETNFTVWALLWKKNRTPRKLGQTVYRSKELKHRRLDTHNIRQKDKITANTAVLWYMKIVFSKEHKRCKNK